MDQHVAMLVDYCLSWKHVLDSNITSNLFWVSFTCGINETCWDCCRTLILKFQLLEVVKTTPNIVRKFSARSPVRIPDEKLAPLREMSKCSNFPKLCVVICLWNKNNSNTQRLASFTTIDMFIWQQCHTYGRRAIAKISCQKILRLWKLYQPRFIWQNHRQYNITGSVKCVKTIYQMCGNYIG